VGPNADHAHAPIVVAEAAPDGSGSGSSGSRVISAIISRSCGERTTAVADDDDDSCSAVLGGSEKSALGDDVDICEE
jgi:hypothetical protein